MSTAANISQILLVTQSKGPENHAWNTLVKLIPSVCIVINL